MQPSRTVGSSRWSGCGGPRASARGICRARGDPLGGEGNTVGMQPPPKGGGKSVGEGAGITVGMQPSRKREGNLQGEGRPVGGARATRLGCSPRASGSVKKFPGPILAKSEA
jgi:hypothetical protein